MMFPSKLCFKEEKSNGGQIRNQKKMLTKLVSRTGNQSLSCFWLSPFLPDELVSEILLRLPVKSLLRFRCVCKSWKTLISDPQFEKDHLRNSIADPNMTHLRLLYSTVEDLCKIDSYSLESLFHQNPSKPSVVIATICDKFRILGSCDGLLCLFATGHSTVRLWNPSTRRGSKVIPIGNVVCTDYHGLGYDHVSDKYKLVVVLKEGDNAVTKVFTFGASSWTTIQNFPYHPSGLRRSGKSLSGTLNWIANRGESESENRPYKFFILSLDLGKETFGELLLPEVEGNEIYCPMLDVLSNCLCFCVLDLEKKQWVVWLMKEYGIQESWTKLVMIRDIGWICRWGFSVDSLCILKNRVVLLKTSFVNLLLCNSSYGRLIYPMPYNQYELNLHIYHESLVSPPC